MNTGNEVGMKNVKWIQIVYTLPGGSPTLQYSSRKFKEFLKDLRFDFIKPGLAMAFCDEDRVDDRLSLVKNKLPKGGSLSILVIDDEAYSKIITYIGK
jgi:CRISPR/Cas system-associated protein endoribonuclease Cas2